MSQDSQITSQFYSRLWRFNAYVIAATGLIAITLGAYALFEVGKSVFRLRHIGGLATAPKTGTSPTNDAAHSKPKLAIGSFTRIAGTTVLRAPVSSSEDRRIRYYSKTATATRNYIFYNTATGEQHRLLPDDLALVTSRYDLRQHAVVHQPPGAAKKASPPIALMFLIVDKDSNGDGLLSRRDRKTLAFTRPDGSGLTRREISFDHVLGQDVISGNEIVVFVKQDGGVNAIHISLQNFTILRQIKIKN